MIYLLIFLSLILKIFGNLRNLFFVTLCMLLFYQACNKDKLNPVIQLMNQFPEKYITENRK
jgi:hypothetical protein